MLTYLRALVECFSRTFSSHVVVQFDSGTRALGDENLDLSLTGQKWKLQYARVKLFFVSGYSVLIVPKKQTY